MNLLINILFLIIGFTIIIVKQKRYASPVNHFNIFGLIWPIITIGTQIAYPGSLTIEVIVYFYICWLLYLVGSSQFRHKFPPNFMSPVASVRKLKILIFVLIIFCLISNYEIMSLIISSRDLLAWAALRKENGFEEIESNIFITLFQRAYLIYIPLAILLMKRGELTIKYLIVLILSGLFLSSLKFTRAPILNLLIVSLISYVYIYKRKLPVLPIISGVSVIVAAFVISSITLTNGASDYSLLEDIKIYLFSGQIAFQEFFEGNYIDQLKYDMNFYSLDFFNYILKKLGVIDSYPSYVREYSLRSGVFTNIYTYLDCFVYDMGYLGGLIGSFVLGFFSDLAYNLYARRGNIFALIFYAYICYYNCFVFANNEFVRFSVLLLAISLIIYNFILKEKKNDRIE